MTSTSITETVLMAYIDGELPADERLRLEALAQTDPALAARLEKAAQLRERIAGAYRHVVDEPAPEALLDIIHKSTGAPSGPVAGRSRSWMWGAVAASWLVTAATLVIALQPDREAAAYMADNGRLYAGKPLAAALSEREAGQPASAGVQVILSFRTDSGLCRTFSLDTTTAGVACREQNRWRIATVADAPDAMKGAYRMAGAPLPTSVLAFVDASIVGEPLSAAEEQAAKARGWSTGR